MRSVRTSSRRPTASRHGWASGATTSATEPRSRALRGASVAPSVGPSRTLFAGMPVLLERTLALLCASLLAVGLAACGTGSTVSSSFKGEEHEVAQTIANLQSDATVGEQEKICASLLSSALVKQLSTIKGGCAQAIKNQIAQVDSFVVSVKSVHI